MKEIFELNAAIWKTLASPVRMEIINILGGKAMTVGEIAGKMKTGRAVVSRHISVMKSREIVASGKEGTNICYRIANPKIVQSCSLIREVLMEADINKIFKESKNIAVAGISNKMGRPSLTVASYLKGQGYSVIPVNPNYTEVMGEMCYPNLESIPAEIDVVDIFRKTEDVMPIVESAIKIGVKVVWMQEGIVNEEAAIKAREAGLLVVMDRCILKEHIKRKGGLR